MSQTFLSSRVGSLKSQKNKKVFPFTLSLGVIAENLRKTRDAFWQKWKGHLKNSTRDNPDSTRRKMVFIKLTEWIVLLLHLCWTVVTVIINYPLSKNIRTSLKFLWAFMNSTSSVCNILQNVFVYQMFTHYLHWTCNFCKSKQSETVLPFCRLDLLWWTTSVCPTAARSAVEVRPASISTGRDDRVSSDVDGSGSKEVLSRRGTVAGLSCEGTSSTITKTRRRPKPW